MTKQPKPNRSDRQKKLNVGFILARRNIYPFDGAGGMPMDVANDGVVIQHFGNA